MRPAQPQAGHCRTVCACAHPDDRPRYVVLTGGPGAGKTAVLDIVRQRLCRHVYVVEESASIVFGGGFPREDADVPRRAAQRAIFHVQRELEAIASARPETVLAVCDRGTLDGLAYWPGTPDEFLADLQTDLQTEYARYALVIHLHTPPAQHYNNHSNLLRVENAAEALAIDARIARVWAGHPRRIEIDNNDNFLHKAQLALDAIDVEVPTCCQRA